MIDSSVAGWGRLALSLVCSCPCGEVVKKGRWLSPAPPLSGLHGLEVLIDLAGTFED